MLLRERVGLNGGLSACAKNGGDREYESGEGM